RYGGYLVHMGIVLMFIGFTGHAFNVSDVKELAPGDSMKIGSYDLKMIDMQQGQNDNYQWHRAYITAAKNGTPLGVLEPEKRFYLASREGISHVGLRQRP